MEQQVFDTGEGTSAQALREHYDLSNDFFKLWLDPTLTYSSAAWAEGDTLESAQLRKLDNHVLAARAHGAKRVLEVGCGWGNLLQRLVTAHGVEHVVGLTLSRAQADHIAQLKLPNTEVRVESWIEHQPPVPYDAIISICAMEHMCKPLRGAEYRIAQYRRFFEHCHRWLRKDGFLSMQTISKGAVKLDRRAMQDAFFIAREIFKESELAALTDILHACDRLFEVVVVRNDREDYMRTCIEWRTRLLGKRAEAVAIVGERVVANYERYLDASIRQFQLSQAGLLRIALRRVE